MRGQGCCTEWSCLGGAQNSSLLAPLYGCSRAFCWSNRLWGSWNRTLFPGSSFRGQATLTLIPLAVTRNGSPGATPGGTVTSHVFVCSSLAVVADTPEDAEEVL